MAGLVSNKDIHTQDKVIHSLRSYIRLTTCGNLSLKYFSLGLKHNRSSLNYIRLSLKYMPGDAWCSILVNLRVILFDLAEDPILCYTRVCMRVH